MSLFVNTYSKKRIKNVSLDDNLVVNFNKMIVISIYTNFY